MNRFVRLVFCATILFALGLRGYGLWVNSPVQSEDAHLASGVAHWLFERFDLYKVNPPLVRVVAAIPVVGRFSKDNDWYRYDASPHARSEFVLGIDVVRDRDDRMSLLIRSRLFTCVVFGVVGLCFLWKFSESAFDVGAGFVALGLWSSNPYVLGHGATIMPDVPSAELAVAAVYCFWQWLRQPDFGNAFLSGVVLGLAELTKFTLLIFYPLFVLLWLIYRLPERKSPVRNKFRSQILQLGVLFAVSLFVVNMGYLFEGTGKPLGSFKFQTTLLTGCQTLKDVPTGGGNRFADDAWGKIPVPLPANYIQGVDTQRFDFERGLQSYLRGEWSDRGWGHYYLYALLVKTPVGTLLLFLLAIVCTFFLKGYNMPRRDEALMLLPGVVLLAFVSSQTGFSVHSRYAIPALPFFFLWASKVGRAFTGIPRPTQAGPNKERTYPQGYKTVRALTVVFLAWSALSSLSVYPHSISYFNELAAIIPTPKTDDRPQIPPIQKPTSLYDWSRALASAGPRNGPRHLLNSNIDWGQDLFNLERWCKNHPEVEKLKVAYWGTNSIELTSIPTVGFPGQEPEPGWYAISVNFIHSREGEYRYFLDYAPVDRAGYSIYIYCLTQEEIDAVEARESTAK